MLSMIELFRDNRVAAVEVHFLVCPLADILHLVLHLDLRELAKGKRRKVDAREGEWSSRGSVSTIASSASGDTVYEDATEEFEFDSEGLEAENEEVDTRTFIGAFHLRSKLAGISE